MPLLPREKWCAPAASLDIARQIKPPAAASVDEVRPQGLDGWPYSNDDKGPQRDQTIMGKGETVCWM